jgi:predicted N-acetyltransferase YhbS
VPASPAATASQRQCQRHCLPAALTLTASAQGSGRQAAPASAARRQQCSRQDGQRVLVSAALSQHEGSGSTQAASAMALLPAAWAVRPALQAELASVVTCINEAFAHKPGDVDYSMDSGGRTSADDIQGCHDAEGCVVFCCCDGADRVVGAVVFNSDGVATTEPAIINMLAVRPSHERRGIAGLLVAACEGQAAREGRPSVRAEIVSVQEHLQGVYESWVRKTPLLSHFYTKIEHSAGPGQT